MTMPRSQARSQKLDTALCSKSASVAPKFASPDTSSIVQSIVENSFSNRRMPVPVSKNAFMRSIVILMHSDLGLAICSQNVDPPPEHVVTRSLVSSLPRLFCALCMLCLKMSAFALSILRPDVYL